MQEEGPFDGVASERSSVWHSNAEKTISISDKDVLKASSDQLSCIRAQYVATMLTTVSSRTKVQPLLDCNSVNFH